MIVLANFSLFYQFIHLWCPNGRRIQNVAFKSNAGKFWHIVRSNYTLLGKCARIFPSWWLSKWGLAMSIKMQKATSTDRHRNQYPSEKNSGALFQKEMHQAFSNIFIPVREKSWHWLPKYAQLFGKQCKDFSRSPVTIIQWDWLLRCFTLVKSLSKNTFIPALGYFMEWY